MNGRHSHDHRPPTAAGRHARALAWALALRSDFLVVEIAAGFWTGSLALLADAGHMLTDASALVLALFAAWLAGAPPTPTKTKGNCRVEIVAAGVNALVLFALSAAILYEAYRRFVTPPDVLGGPMVVVAVVGLLVNLASRWLLRAGAHESLNVKGVYPEVVRPGWLWRGGLRGRHPAPVACGGAPGVGSRGAGRGRCPLVGMDTAPDKAGLMRRRVEFRELADGGRHLFLINAFKHEDAAPPSR